MAGNGNKLNMDKPADVEKAVELNKKADEARLSAEADKQVAEQIAEGKEIDAEKCQIEKAAILSDPAAKVPEGAKFFSPGNSFMRNPFTGQVFDNRAADPVKRDPWVKAQWREGYLVMQNEKEILDKAADERAAAKK